MEWNTNKKEHRRSRIYIAAPLFNSAEKDFNKELKSRLAASFDVFLPQEDGGLLVDYVEKGIPVDYAARAVFDIDIKAIDECDILIIVMDGRVIDEGATFELGYAHAKGKSCYGLQTDVRRLLLTGNNPMIDCSCERIFNDVDELVTWVQNRHNNASKPEIHYR